MSLKVGILGAGNIASTHARGYLKAEDLAKVTAIADPNRKAAETLSAQLGGVSIYDSWEELLDQSDVDAVDLCLPHYLHCEVAVAAAQSGRHVLVEKPIARTLEEADAMIDAADKAGVKLMVSHDRRYHPMFVKIKELLESGAIGRVHCLRLDHNQNIRFPKEHWAYSKELLGGGAIASCLVHQLDLMRWLAGPVSLVGCVSLTLPDRLEGEAIGIVPMRFESGAVGDAVINWAVEGRGKRGLWYELLWVSGEGGSIHNLGGVHVLQYAEGGGEYEQIAVEEGTGHERAIRHFLECIIEEREPLTNGREGRESLALALAAYESEATGAFVGPPV